jgi:type I restriction enzyme S subunit
MIWLRQVGMAREGLSKQVLEQFEVPFPPLPEQRRIVAKIDQLMTLCDALDAQLSARTGKQAALLDAVMSEYAVAAPAPRPVPRAPKAQAAERPAEASDQPRRRGRPPRAGRIPEATSEADAIRQLEARKLERAQLEQAQLERAQGTRQPSLFEG